jgi:polysaccharide export outer membrane protein
MRIRRTAVSLLLPTVLLGLAGCTQLIPGMNVHVGGPGQHQYRVSGAKPSPMARKLLRYQVIPITPQVVASILTHPDPPIIAPSGAPPLKPLLPSTAQNYRIGPGDVISVTVWDHPQLNLTAGIVSPNTTFNGQLVDPDGTMFYPFIGTFKVAGMTVPELRRYLTEHLQQVIQKPQVGVRVVVYDSKRVEITGEVAKPGTIALTDIPEGILQAIDAAGGLAPGASRRRAILLRHGVRYQIDLADLLSGNRLVSNPELEPGDIIHIPDQSTDQVFVLGAATSQKPLVMTQSSMTLMQALTDAGGLDDTRASGSGVLVFRLPTGATQGAEAKVYTIDMSTPQGVLLASQFPLRPRDVVYVAATEFSQYNSVINQLLPTITSIFELHQVGAF